ncbi:MAG: MarP family serine protease [Actinomycetota bacterium]|nr:MarP family serine protease [Actinomycetota bacterium]MCL6094085.1 MarP family serine protease [Actinomycetota bacterium]MDA8167833.1 MarP family serine protease [Actinomycetota bacterium]
MISPGGKLPAIAMDFVDLIIIFFLVSAVVRGVRTGLMQLLLSSTGFVAGLLLGSWAASRIAPLSASPPIKLFIVLFVELGLAMLLGFLGELAGLRLNLLARRLHLHGLDEALGAALAVIFALTVIWLAASALVNVHSFNIGREVRQSLIVQKLDAIMPEPPDILAQLEKIISPNGFPNVFLQLEPQHTTVAPNNSVNNQAVINDESSVVKVHGEGCGGTVTGSGFVAARGIVVTNAHVVAGIARPEVVDGSGTYRATPIWFDPDMDVAVLRVGGGLKDPPLTLDSKTLPDNDAAAVLGFPGGGPLVAGNGVIIDHVTAVGRNIYNQGLVSRSIYEVQAIVQPGNSGGPLIAPDGTVAGIVFARSLSQKNVGYALTIGEVQPLIRQAALNNSAVSTGSCAAE